MCGFVACSTAFQRCLSRGGVNVGGKGFSVVEDVKDDLGFVPDEVIQSVLETTKMKMVMISQPAFNLAFERCLKEMELEAESNKHLRLCPEVDVTPGQQYSEVLRNMHRKFHYKVCELKNDLESC